MLKADIYFMVEPLRFICNTFGGINVISFGFMNGKMRKHMKTNQARVDFPTEKPQPSENETKRYFTSQIKCTVAIPFCSPLPDTPVRICVLLVQEL